MKRYLNSLVVILAAVVISGCASSNTDVAAAPEDDQSPEAYKQGYDLTYAHMTENALLADMSMSDYHFLPDRPLLTSLGQQRLSKLAALIKEYGGSIRLSTDATDEALVAARVTLVRDFLGEAGLSTTEEHVKRDLPGGHGMDSAQVILIHKNEGSYKVKKSGAGGGAAGAEGAGGQNGGGAPSGNSPY